MLLHLYALCVTVCDAWSCAFDFSLFFVLRLKSCS